MWTFIMDVLAKASSTDWILMAVSIGLLLYIWGTWNYDYFERRGLPSLKPKIPFFGNTGFFGREPPTTFMERIHKGAEGRGLLGIFQLTKPVYAVFCPEYIKLITVKYFDHFMNHSSFTDPESDKVFNKNLFSMKDQRWRNFRALVSPAFTTSKIKATFPLISLCGEQMVEHLKTKYNSKQTGAEVEPMEVDIKDLFSRFCNDVIASLAFGVQCDSLKEPENDFFKKGKELTVFTRWRTFVFIINMLLPKYAKYISSDIIDPKASAYFEKIVAETMKEREKKGIFRPDILQLMMQTRKGELKAEAEDEEETDKMKQEKEPITDKFIIGQCVVFFLAGFETVSIAMSFTAIALSLNPEVQKRLQKELDETTEQAGGQFSYDVIQSMKYLDMVVQESLRLYPPSIATDRVCTQNVMLPAVGDIPAIYLKKGDLMNLPIISIHHDPKYWPDPLTFNPERFSEENKHNITPLTYLPFGLGPRNCIAQRLAILEVKIAVAYLVKNFTLLQSKKLKLPIEYENGININIKGGFWCDLIPR